MQCKLIELKRQEDIRLVKLLIDKYHLQGCPKGSGMAKHSRFFALECEGYWVAVCWIHESAPFKPIAIKHKISLKNTYFIRRICQCAPGQYGVTLLKLLAEKLKAEGKETLWTLGLTNHSNALYKKAGFKQIGTTPRTKHPIFKLQL